MANRTLEGFVGELKNSLGDNLVSVVLYGSSATGDHAGAWSDTNLLVVTELLSSRELDLVSEPVRRWVKSGQPSPVFFTRDEIRDSADVFPIEYADLMDARKVIHGRDVFRAMVLAKSNLRAELEREFRAKILRLRAGYLAAGGKDRRIRDLMLQSVSTFLVLMKAMVRLYGEKPPLKKAEALTILRARFEFNDEIFRALDRARTEGAPRGEAKQMFTMYLSALEDVVKRIDGKTGGSGKGKTSRSKR